jgi:hypothetical protein
MGLHYMHIKMNEAVRELLGTSDIFFRLKKRGLREMILIF